MIAEIFITVSLIWYFLAEGATEGFTWANLKRRKENKLIRGRFDGTPARGLLDYHSWRMFGEELGIVGTAVAAAFAGLSGASLFAGIAGWLIGLFVYQRAQDYVYCGKLFNPIVGSYHILGLNLPRGGKWSEYGALLVGIGAFVASFFV